MLRGTRSAELRSADRGTTAICAPAPAAPSADRLLDLGGSLGGVIEAAERHDHGTRGWVGVGRPASDRVSEVDRDLGCCSGSRSIVTTGVLLYGYLQVLERADCHQHFNIILTFSARPRWLVPIGRIVKLLNRDSLNIQICVN